MISEHLALLSDLKGSKNPNFSRAGDEDWPGWELPSSHKCKVPPGLHRFQRHQCFPTIGDAAMLKIYRRILAPVIPRPGLFFWANDQRQLRKPETLFRPAPQLRAPLRPPRFSPE